MNTRITLDHGSGGLASQNLISELFLRHLDNPLLHDLEDCAVLPREGQGRLALSTDSFVVDPIIFPGGTIGDLAVHGTINDLAMRGAMPLALSLGLIIEEGLEMDVLETVIRAVGAACRAAGVEVVTGDTKVVPAGKADRIYINTSGIGLVADGVDISGGNARPGDAVILSGTLADHGITIMTCRAGLRMEGDLRSDTAPLHRMIQRVLDAHPGVVRVLRDPTRGGLATTLCEIARASRVAIVLEEEAIPLRPQVRAACELIGLDPLYLANEGKCLLMAPAREAEDLVKTLRCSKAGRDATVIGRVEEGPPGRVTLRTGVGGSRLLEALTGEPLPRIC